MKDKLQSEFDRLDKRERELTKKKATLDQWVQKSTLLSDLKRRVKGFIKSAKAGINELQKIMSDHDDDESDDEDEEDEEDEDSEGVCSQKILFIC